MLKNARDSYNTIIVTMNTKLIQNCESTHKLS
jgi:hypothetical protein